jgi:hypothetical protein
MIPTSVTESTLLGFDATTGAPGLWAYRAGSKIFRSTMTLKAE